MKHSSSLNGFDTIFAATRYPRKHGPYIHGVGHLLCLRRCFADTVKEFKAARNTFDSYWLVRFFCNDLRQFQAVNTTSSLITHLLLG